MSFPEAMRAALFWKPIEMKARHIRAADSGRTWLPGRPAGHGSDGSMICRPLAHPPRDGGGRALDHSDGSRSFPGWN